MEPNLGFIPVKTGNRYFISYKKTDAERVGRITRRLNKMGVPMWYDYGIKYGEEWKKAINTNIYESLKVIMFLTEDVFQDPGNYLVEEYELACRHSKEVVCVWFEDPTSIKFHKDLAPFYNDLAKKQGFIITDKTPDKIACSIADAFSLIKGKTSQSSSAEVVMVILLIFAIIGGAIGSASTYDQNSDVPEDNYIIGDRINSYILVQSDERWEDAWNKCLERGGHLAWINSELELSYIINYLNTYSGDTNATPDFVYLGGIRGDDDKYYWKNTDGNVFSEDIADTSIWSGTHWYSSELSYEGELMQGIGDGRSQDVVSLIHLEDQWFFEDVSDHLVEDYPDTHSGNVGYLIEFEGGLVIPQSDQIDGKRILKTEVTLFNGMTVSGAEFIFPHSSSRVITTEELNNLSHNKDERITLSQIAINEILARYGYYPTADTHSALTIRNKYEDREWYNIVRTQCPSAKQDTLIATYLNPVEQDNIRIINGWQNKNS